MSEKLLWDLLWHHLRESSFGLLLPSSIFVVSNSAQGSRRRVSITPKKVTTDNFYLFVPFFSTVTKLTTSQNNKSESDIFLIIRGVANSVTELVKMEKS